MEEEYIDDNNINKGTNNIKINYIIQSRKIIESFSIEELLDENDIEKLRQIK